MYLTDGCVDVSRAPDLYLNERAREIAPVRMTGNYGGEVLRGVRAFKPEEPVAGLFAPEFLSHVHQASGDLCRPPSGTSGFLCRLQAGSVAPLRGAGAGADAALHAIPIPRQRLCPNGLSAPESALASNEVSLRLIADGNRALSGIPTDRGLAGNRGTFSGAASRGLLEFLFKAEYAYDMGMPQWVARLDHAFSPLRLERLFLGRHKIFHFRIWYRDALAGYVREMLLDPRSLSRPYIERKGLEAVVRVTLRGIGTTLPNSTRC